jgi:hypothetical protein
VFASEAARSEKVLRNGLRDERNRLEKRRILRDI